MINRSLGLLLLLLLVGQLRSGSRAPVGCGEAGAVCDMLRPRTGRAAAALGGCSTRGVYEGIQQQEAVRAPSPYGQAVPRRPTYDEYEAERRKTGTTPDAR